MAATKFARASSPAVKRTVVKPAKALTPTTKVELPPAPETDDNEVHGAYETLRASMRIYLDKLGKPSWVRNVVSTLIGLIISAGIFYTSTPMIDMLMIAVVGYTGVGFISFVILFLAMLLVTISAITVGNRVSEFVNEFDYANVKRRVGGWFTRTPVAA